MTSARTRKRVVEALSARLTIESRESFPEREVLSCRVGDRVARVTLSAIVGEVLVPLLKPVLPATIRVEESSVWGPQKQESWMSGDAARTGDLEFDLAFMVLGAEPGMRPSPDAARRITPAIRSLLLANRAEIRDASIRADRIVLPVYASRNAAGGAAGRIARRLFGLGPSMPSADDLVFALNRVTQLAQQLEVASSQI